MGARAIGARAISVIAGTVVGFFGSLNSVFSDGGTAERVTAILMTAATVGVVSALGAALDTKGGWRIALWVWAPGALMLAVYVAMGEFSAWMWATFVALITLGGALVGALLGGGRATRRGEA